MRKSSTSRKIMTANTNRMSNNIAALQRFGDSYSERIKAEQVAIVREYYIQAALESEIEKLEEKIKEERNIKLKSVRSTKSMYDSGVFKPGSEGMEHSLRQSKIRDQPNTMDMGPQSEVRPVTTQTGTMKNVKLINTTQRLKYEEKQVVTLKQKCNLANSENTKLNKQVNSLRQAYLMYENYNKNLVCTF